MSDDAVLLQEWGIGLWGYDAGEVAQVLKTIRRVHRRERKWVERELGQEAPEPPDLQAVWHMRRMKGDRR